MKGAVGADAVVEQLRLLLSEGCNPDARLAASVWATPHTYENSFGRQTEAEQQALEYLAAADALASSASPVDYRYLYGPPDFQRCLDELLAEEPK